MNQSDDLLNIGNSVILATSKELKVLKKDDQVSNDDYLFNNPSGICFDENNNLYICDSGNNRIKVLNASLNLISLIESASSPDDKLSQPKSVAIYQNILFVSDSANHRILSYFILNNGTQIKFRNKIGLGYGEEPGMLRYPIECCVDKFGILYVRDHHNNRVQLFNQNSEFFHLIEVNSKHEMIYSMTVSENGDIYVAKMNQHQNHITNSDMGKSDQSLSLSSNNKYYIDIY
jgi:sugar lactone lactonase YvrE